MASSLSILQYVSHELSYDEFHKQAKDTYRVTLDIFKTGSKEVKSARVSPAVASSFRYQFPDIETYTRLVILGHESLKESIPPTLFHCSDEFNYYTVKLERIEMEESLVLLKSTYQEIFPGSPYEYFFLDEFFDRQYKAENQFNLLFRIFAGLSIFIASLGLFGL